VICPDGGVREQLGQSLSDLGPHVVLHHALPGYPSGAELARSLRTFSPQVVFLALEKMDTALAVVRYLESESSGLPVVAVHTETDRERMMESLHMGVRDFLTPPFRGEELTRVLDEVRKLLRSAPLSYAATDHIYSFLPVRAGVGTTTVAMNAAAAFGRESGLKVLLSDLDLTCGMIRFLLRLPQDLSIVDALARAEEMDVGMWPQLVSHRDGIDILHSGSINPQAHLEPGQVQGLIDFARINYSALFFDMSGNLERHSLQVMQESKRVFLVCNPDAGSLFLGREKIQFLHSIGLSSRLSVLINRADQALAVPAPKVQQFLGIPVEATFSDDTFEVTQAIKGAQFLFTPGRKTPLTGQVRAFARQLIQNRPPAPVPDHRMVSAVV
jgi:pilus assembly protein CpaE